MAAQPKDYLKCPCCGHNVPRQTFTRGALGHSLQALRQHFVGRGNGTNGGAVIWQRRPMAEDELRAVGRALAKAEETLVEYLGEQTLPEMPESVLASLDDAQAQEIGDDWVREAEDELERRRQIVEADRQRRIFDVY